MSKYSCSELLGFSIDGLPSTERGIQKKADREKWPFEEVKAKGGRGGVKKLYAPPPRHPEKNPSREAQSGAGRYGGGDSGRPCRPAAACHGIRPACLSGCGCSGSFIRPFHLRRVLAIEHRHRGAAQLRSGADGGVAGSGKADGGYGDG